VQMSACLSRPVGLPRCVLAGAVDALTFLVATLSLGIVATASLGPDAIPLGLKAALVAVIKKGPHGTRQEKNARQRV